MTSQGGSPGLSSAIPEPRAHGALVCERGQGLSLVACRSQKTPGPGGCARRTSTGLVGLVVRRADSRRNVLPLSFLGGRALVAGPGRPRARSVAGRPLPGSAPTAGRLQSSFSNVCLLRPGTFDIIALFSDLQKHSGVY